MNNPLVTILMPVYNGERFLREAIDSLLSQTYRNIEILIINDGSTDQSGEIIRSYQDKRIRYVVNERNSGLIFTLNRGLELATGEYLARMDSDDVCAIERIGKQASYLEQHPDIAIVATTIEMMDEAGKPLPPWTDDRNNIHPEAIRRFLLKDNCIAHPSIMARTALLQRYRFQADQKEAEDYDLWLRLCADGHQIAKIDEPLLRYRVVATGLTRKEGLSAFERLSRTKGKFLAERRRTGKWNGYCRQLWLHYLWDRFRFQVKKWWKG